LQGVKGNPAIMRLFDFDFRQKSGFGSKFEMSNLRTSSKQQIYDNMDNGAFSLVVATLAPDT